jgi:hypothetical protein
MRALASVRGPLLVRVAVMVVGGLVGRLVHHRGFCGDDYSHARTDRYPALQSYGRYYQP